MACDDGSPCLYCSCLQPHVDCIVIAVDGACKGNGLIEARAAAGVYVGKDSIYNKSTIVTESEATNQVAELTAGILGLSQAIEIQAHRVEGEPLYQVVIKSDSEYLVKGITERMFKWERNSY